MARNKKHTPHPPQSQSFPVSPWCSPVWRTGFCCPVASPFSARGVGLTFLTQGLQCFLRFGVCVGALAHVEGTESRREREQEKREGGYCDSGVDGEMVRFHNWRQKWHRKKTKMWTQTELWFWQSDNSHRLEQFPNMNPGECPEASLCQIWRTQQELVQVRCVTGQSPEPSGEGRCRRAAGGRTGQIVCLCLQHINTSVDPYRHNLSNLIFPS